MGSWVLGPHICWPESTLATHDFKHALKRSAQPKQGSIRYKNAVAADVPGYHVRVNAAKYPLCVSLVKVLQLRHKVHIHDA